MSRAWRFIVEMRRRRVFRAVAVYAVGAWIVLQVVLLSSDAIGNTGPARRYIAYALAAGLPVVLVIAWIFRVTPDGIERDTERELRRRKLGLRLPDYLILAALGAMILAFAAGIVDEIG